MDEFSHNCATEVGRAGAHSGVECVVFSPLVVLGAAEVDTREVRVVSKLGDPVGAMSSSNCRMFSGEIG